MDGLQKMIFNLKQYRLVESEVDLFKDDGVKLKPFMIEVIKHQDEMALKSIIFEKILNSEIKSDPVERYYSTNDPKSKTRNALLIRSIYDTQDEWERDLLTNPFYELSPL